MVSIRRTFSSRATIEAGTRPPRVTATIPVKGPASSRQASRARADTVRNREFLRVMQLHPCVSRFRYENGAWGCPKRRLPNSEMRMAYENSYFVVLGIVASGADRLTLCPDSPMSARRAARLPRCVSLLSC